MIFLGLLLCMLGFIIGLGAVVVIDLHGFLAQRSSYRTQATIRTHKITKPLIRIGTILLLTGLIVLYTQFEQQITLWQLLLIIPMVANGTFLSFYISPILLRREKEMKHTKILLISLQRKIMISLLCSDVIWRGQVVLFILFIKQFLL